MSRRLGGLLVGLVLVELVVFYGWHRDVVLLNQSRAALLADARFPGAASAVLSRERISRRVLERVADVAYARHELVLHVRALERIVDTVPDDAEARLRLAQALREAGRLDEAERLYRRELGLPADGGGR